MFSHSENNEQATKQFFNLLKAQEVNFVSDVTKKTSIIEWKGDWYCIHDNGGELNIEKINFDETLQSIPYESNLITIDTLTMVYRVLRYLNNEPIDYKFSADYGILI